MQAVYDVNRNNGTITCFLPKKEQGEDFEDLDLLTKLVQKSKKVTVGRGKMYVPAVLHRIILSVM